ncbi:MAG: ABC-type antimicrobial peptide transport system, permease component, partial [uncultured Gemmatimonadetes bacterium]
ERTRGGADRPGDDPRQQAARVLHGAGHRGGRHLPDRGHHPDHGDERVHEGGVRRQDPGLQHHQRAPPPVRGRRAGGREDLARLAAPPPPDARRRALAGGAGAHSRRPRARLRRDGEGGRRARQAHRGCERGGRLGRLLQRARAQDRRGAQLHGERGRPRRSRGGAGGRGGPEALRGPAGAGKGGAHREHPLPRHRRAGKAGDAVRDVDGPHGGGAHPLAHQRLPAAQQRGGRHLPARSGRAADGAGPVGAGGADARAAPPEARRGERLHPGDGRRGAGLLGQDLVVPPHRPPHAGDHLAGGGRRGHHEHHAGGRVRAHEGDRGAQVAGRAAPRHPPPVPGGGGHPFRGRRGAGDPRRRGAGVRGGGGVAHPGARVARLHHAGDRAGGGGGADGRGVPGLPRFAAGPHRRPSGGL